MPQMNLTAVDDRCAKNRCPAATGVTRENGNFSILCERIPRLARQRCELRCRYPGRYCSHRILRSENTRKRVNQYSSDDIELTQASSYVMDWQTVLREGAKIYVKESLIYSKWKNVFLHDTFAMQVVEEL